MPARQSAASPPRFIQPQLSQLVAKPPEGDRWCHELKLDGYRLHARIVGKEVKLLTRIGLVGPTSTALRRVPSTLCV
jgi:ATP-dependent DNA ligase